MNEPTREYTLEEYHQIVQQHPDRDFTYDNGKIFLMTGYTIDHPTHSVVRENIASSLGKIYREKYRDAILKAYDEKKYDVMYKIIAERDKYEDYAFEKKGCANRYPPNDPEKPLFYIPDVLVAAVDLLDSIDVFVSNETFEAAVLLVDIYCEAGERSKKQDKLAGYQRHQRYSNVQEILVVNPHRKFIEHFRRSEANQWKTLSYTQDKQVIELVTLEIRLPVRNIYHQVPLEEEGKGRDS